MTKKPSWQEKLNDSKDLPKIVVAKGNLAKHWGKGKMVVPCPLDVDGVMKKVPKGKVITVSEIRKAVAKKYKADYGCPLTSGIFTWISANAAEEAKSEGKKNTTPYFRTLKSGGEINPKYPGGIETQKKLLEKENHQVIQKGKKYFVLDYEKKLAKI